MAGGGYKDKGLASWSEHFSSEYSGKHYLMGNSVKNSSCFCSHLNNGLTNVKDSSVYIDKKKKRFLPHLRPIKNCISLFHQHALSKRLG